MENKENTHDIFITNPKELLEYIGSYVKIVLENNETLDGTVYTIDPVSRSVVLLTKKTPETQSLAIVLKHSIVSMEILTKTTDESINILGNDIFKSEKGLPSENEKENVKNWLLKNMIPVVEFEDKLVIDTLEIHPPYGVDQCYCNNSIVLSRIQTLLSQMPTKSS